MFFSKSQLSKQAKIEVDIDSLRSHCASCGLDKECKSPRMEYAGEGRKKILVVGDVPSSQDDFMIIPFSDDAGNYLRELLKEQKINFNKDCWRTTAIRCHTSKEQRSKNTKLCSGYLYKLLYTLKPTHVLILGDDAVDSIFPECKDRSVPLFRGIDIHDQKFKSIFFTTFHPANVIDKEFDYNLKSVFERDIKQFSFVCKRAFKERSDDENKLEIVTDYKRVVQILESILKRKDSVYFDYETTGLKPYKPGHKIASIGLAISSNKAFSFPFEYNSFWTNKEFQHIKKLWTDILADPQIRTMAHNFKFEDMWSSIILGQRPTKFMWDTMIAAHIIDNRSRFTGLKIQSLFNFGIREYDKHMKQYLDSEGKEFNNVMKAPLKDLLIYNALDCLYGFELFEKQKDYLKTKKGLLAANSFFHKGIANMSNMQLAGICMDSDYYKKQRQILTWKIKKLKRQLTKGREARKFYEYFGRNINITSNQDLGKLFYEVLGMPPIKTAKGNYRTDKETISSLNLPFVEKLLDMKRLEKARGTYLAQFAREVHNNKMHPFFGLNIPKTYRSSSQKPNFQNQPKRDDEIMRICRSGIIPSEKSVIMEADFSGAEVITSVCVTGDTKIETIEGQKTIKQIINRIKNQKVFVYGYCLNEKRIKISQVTAGGITGKKKEVWKVTLDNGEIVKATSNHKFMIRYGSKSEGKYVELQNLKPGMSLMPFYKKKKNGYYYINLNNRNSIGEHTLIGRDVLNKNVGGSCCSNVMHHKDGDGLNNSLKNLEFMTREEHTSLHHKGKITGPHSEEHKQKISKAIKGIPCPQRGVKQTDEQKRALSLRMTGREFTESHREKLSLNKKDYWKNKDNEVCKICGRSFRKITNTHLLHSHDMSLEEYKKEYNHKVLSIEFHGYEDVYNINVEGIHNYAVSAGVILKNCYHKDPTFYNYLTEKNEKGELVNDMHRDQALDLWMLDRIELENPIFNREESALAKKIRFFAKNNWTFAQFYGDWFDSCARSLWENCIEGGLKLPSGQLLYDHISSKGIYDLEQFIEHCKDVEHKLWNERFPQYTQWKKDIVKFYQKNGFIETFFGFRFQGYMDKKQCTNYPIQGTSFHLLLHTLIEVARFIKENKLRTKIIGQIHDSVISNVYLEEVEFYTQGLNNIISNLHKRFKWLIVPMEMEAEITKPREMGGNFSAFYAIKPNVIHDFDFKKIYKDALTPDEYMLLEKAA